MKNFKQVNNKDTEVTRAFLSCWLDLRTNEELKVKIVWGDNEEEIVESYVAKNILNIDKSYVYYCIDEEGYECFELIQKDNKVISVHQI